MKQSFSQPLTQLHPSIRQNASPIKEQWALINQYKALQFERLKQKEQQLQQQKKQRFKRQLDIQLNSKSSQHTKEHQADRKYYEFVVQQATAQREKQERERFQRLVKRRQCEEQNARLLQVTKNSRMHSQGRQDVSQFEIGTKSQYQHKLKSQHLKRKVLDTLDEQLRIKQQQRQQQRQQQQYQLNKNLNYQQAYEHNRNNNKKQFGQNQQVYEYYNELQRQKKMKDFHLEHKLVDQAALKIKYEEDQRLRNEQYKKIMAKDDMKETLDQQVRQHNIKKLQEQRVNPEDNSYGFIGNVFRQRKATYDKQKYMQQLQVQAQIQKQKKKMENYMSDEQYKLNMNQLNKVVNGQYTYSNYVDRSLGTIGDNKQFRLADIRDSIVDKDSEQIREKMENLRKRNQSEIIQKNDRTAFF